MATDVAGKTLEIRLAVPEDFSAIRGLMATNALLVDGMDYATFTPPILLACDGDRIMGFVQAILGKPYSVISEVAIDRAYHNQRIGSQLLHAMECLLKGMGYTTWIGFVSGHRENVQERVEHLGARCLGEGRAYMKVLSEY